MALPASPQNQTHPEPVESSLDRTEPTTMRTPLLLASLTAEQFGNEEPGSHREKILLAGLFPGMLQSYKVSPHNFFRCECVCVCAWVRMHTALKKV